MTLKNVNEQPHVMQTLNRVTSKHENLLVIPITKFKNAYVTLTDSQFKELNNEEGLYELTELTHKNNRIFLFKK